MQKSFFSNSGTEANENAILLARMAGESFDIVVLRQAYSGASTLAKGVTAHAAWRKGGVISVGVAHAVNPYCYRCPLHLRYPDCGVACANAVENLIQTATSGRIAAFIAEPIQGVGGFITPPREYFKIVYRIVKNYGEFSSPTKCKPDSAAQAGNGLVSSNGKWLRTSSPARKMVNGVPVGATLTTSEIADKFQGLTISTFGGNPVTCVAARAVIDIIEEENLLEPRSAGGNFRAGP